MALALVQAVFYLVVGLAFGVRLEIGGRRRGRAARPRAVIALAFASFGALGRAAHRVDRGSAGLFPVFFVFLFISSMNIPRNLMETDWFRWFATINPVSYLIEAVRSLVIDGWDWETLGLGFAVGDRLRRSRLHARGARACRTDGRARERRARHGRDAPSRGGSCTTFFTNPSSCCRRCCSRCSSSPRSPAGCRAYARCPDSTSRSATPRSSSCSCSCSRPRSPASSPASASRATSRPASCAGSMLARAEPDRHRARLRARVGWPLGG